MSSTSSKLTKSSSSSRMTPAPISRALSARSVPRTAKSTSSVTSSQSKEGAFKRPKDIAVNRSNDVQRSLRMAKYLQTRLKCLKLEDDLKKRQDYYSDKITEIWAKNNDMSDRIFTKKLVLEKLKLYKETLDRLNHECEFLDDLITKLNAMENDLQPLVDHIETLTSQIILKGVDKQSLEKLHVIFYSLSNLDGSAASKIASLAKEVSKLRCLVDEYEKVKEDVERLKVELDSIKQEHASLKAVEKTVTVTTS